MIFAPAVAAEMGHWAAARGSIGLACDWRVAHAPKSANRIELRILSDCCFEIQYSMFSTMTVRSELVRVRLARLVGGILMTGAERLTIHIHRHPWVVSISDTRQTQPAKIHRYN